MNKGEGVINSAKAARSNVKRLRTSHLNLARWKPWLTLRRRLLGVERWVKVCLEQFKEKGMRAIHGLSVDYPFKMASCTRQQRRKRYLAEVGCQRKVLFLSV